MLSGINMVLLKYNVTHVCAQVQLPIHTDVVALGTGLLCLIFYLLCYAALLIKFTYYAQIYAQE